MKIIICGNRHQDSHLAGIASFLQQMRVARFTLNIERRFADYLIATGNISIPDSEIIDYPPADAHAAVSIGGDGTFLRTARWIGKLMTPILGINTGHLGFLANYTLPESSQLISLLRNCSEHVEARAMLKISGNDIPDDIFPYALNEIAILKDDTSSMISVNLNIDDTFLADYLADGLIISTPTGSTGYNLSAGGPILQPTLDTLCISPIAPHTLTLRPIVVSGDSILYARTTSRAPSYRVSLDGVSFTMPQDSAFVISQADFRVNILRRPDDNFPAILRKKLLWGQR